MMKRSVYEQLGGFCPEFMIYGNDEQDISARAWLAGLSVKCVTTAHVGHLTRDRHPFPVLWDHTEFNRIVSMRTIFEPETSKLLEPFFEPFIPRVKQWLAAVDLGPWRSVVQANRKMDDAEFFSRLAPLVPIVFNGSPQLKPGAEPPYLVARQRRRG